VARLFGIDGQVNAAGNFVIASEPQAILTAKAS